MLTAFALRRVAALQHRITVGSVRRLASTAAASSGNAGPNIRTTVVPHDEEVVHDTEERLAHLHEAEQPDKQLHGSYREHDALADEDAAGLVRRRMLSNSGTRQRSIGFSTSVVGIEANPLPCACFCPLCRLHSAGALLQTDCLAHPAPGSPQSAKAWRSRRLSRRA